MLRVICDGRPMQAGYKAHRERGIGRYAKNLLAELAQIMEPGALRVMVRTNLPDPGLPPSVERVNLGNAPTWLPVGKWLISDHLLSKRPLGLHWAAGQPVHYLSHLDAPFRVSRPTVVTVHDLIAQRLKDLYCDRSRVRFRLQRHLETRCLYRASRLLADSQQTKQDLVELYGLDPQGITVVYLAADPALAPVEDPGQRAASLRHYGLEDDEPFFIYMGGIDQRKDLPTLLWALAILLKRGQRARLALAGGIEQDRQYPRLLETIADLGLQERVKLLGYVADQHLPSLLSASAGFVFPSLYEGFGLPPLEAMACGAPVVAVRASSVPEVVGQAGLMVEPGQAQDMAQAMEALLTQPQLSARLREEGLKQAGRFSWRATAQQVLAVYQEVAHDRRTA